MFESRKSITLKINASDQTIKAYISQLDEKKRLHLIVFYSKKLTDVKLNYKIHD